MMKLMTPDQLTVASKVLDRDDLAKPNKKLKQSLNWLGRHSSDLAHFESIDDLVFMADDVSSLQQGRAKACEYHLTQVRAALARAFWSQGAIIGIDLIDTALLQVCQQKSATILHSVVHDLVGRLLTTPGYVLYPLHSFSFRTKGYASSTKILTEELARRFGVAVAPQSNDLAKLDSWLQNVHSWFGVTSRVPTELIDHWHTTRAPWLESNPVMALRIYTASDDKFDNEQLLLDYLEMATTFLAGLSHLQPASPHEENDGLHSTRKMNNHQTLDIRHYFVMASHVNISGEPYATVVPIRPDSLSVAEASDLPVELDYEYWNNSANLDKVDSLWKTLNMLRSLCLPVRLSAASQSKQSLAKARIARRIADSTHFYRRSLASSRWYASVSLGIAFETLLTGFYSSGVTRRLRERTQKLTGRKVAGQLVEDVYKSRSKTVHSGAKSSLIGSDSQRVYIECLEALVTKLTMSDNSASVDDLFGKTTRDTILIKISGRLRPQR